MEFINGARIWQSISGTHTCLWPLTQNLHRCRMGTSRRTFPPQGTRLQMTQSPSAFRCGKDVPHATESRARSPSQNGT